jgi:hypothetical protein
MAAGEPELCTSSPFGHLRHSSVTMTGSAVVSRTRNPRHWKIVSGFGAVVSRPYKSRDRLGGLSNEVDDGIKTDVRRGDLIGPRAQPDVQLLVKIRVVAESYEGFATDRLTRLKLREPGCRRYCEGSRGALFDFREFVCCWRVRPPAYLGWGADQMPGAVDMSAVVWPVPEVEEVELAGDVELSKTQRNSADREPGAFETVQNLRCPWQGEFPGHSERSRCLCAALPACGPGRGSSSGAGRSRRNVCG